MSTEYFKREGDRWESVDILLDGRRIKRHGLVKKGGVNGEMFIDDKDSFVEIK